MNAIQEAIANASGAVLTDFRPSEELDETGWTTIVRADRHRLFCDPAALWSYRDLIVLFVRRDLVTQYRQTILGPLWLFLQPMLFALTYSLVFGALVGIPTDGVPVILFYLSGTICWGQFAQTFTQSSNTFRANSATFGKVYFPRLAVPIATAVSMLVRFLVQLAVLSVFTFSYYLKGAHVGPTVWLLAVPGLALLMSLLGLGCGCLVSSLTAKYKDVANLVPPFIQLWMFATPVIFPISIVPESYRFLVAFNPMAPVVETFRLALLGRSAISPEYLVLSMAVGAIVLILGIAAFTRTERTFLDTV